RHIDMQLRAFCSISILCLATPLAAQEQTPAHMDRAFERSVLSLAGRNSDGARDGALARFLRNDVDGVCSWAANGVARQRMEMLQNARSCMSICRSLEIFDPIDTKIAAAVGRKLP
ncbi:MAG: hypothetical protein AAFW64_09185, partial [Pseudomonadota bacterium]